MTQSLQFTQEQVARQLQLPQAVVNRLSRYFRIPRSAFVSSRPAPSWMLYRPEEVALLGHIRERIVAGDAMEDVKAWLEDHLATQCPALPETTDMPAADTEACEPPSSEDLVHYPDVPALNQQLAEATFEQYRLKTTPSTPPLQALATKLGATRPVSRRSLFQPIERRRSVENMYPGEMPAVAFGFSCGMSTWLTDDLKRRAYALQQASLYHVRHF